MAQANREDSAGEDPQPRKSPRLQADRESGKNFVLAGARQTNSNKDLRLVPRSMVAIVRPRPRTLLASVRERVRVGGVVGDCRM